MVFDTYAVDFETEFAGDYSVVGSTPTRYCMDPRFHAYLVAIVGPGVSFVGPPAEAPWSQIAGAVWVSHNAGFDHAVWGRLVHDGTIPPSGPAEWHCTAALSSYCQGPRKLKDAAKVWLGSEVSKAYRATAKGKLGADLFGNPEILASARADAEACLALWTLLSPRWPQHERDLAGWGFGWSARGIPCDIPGLQADDALLTAQLDAALAGLPWVPAHKPLSSVAARAQCVLDGIPPPESFAQSDEACAAWEDEHSADRPWIAAFRKYRRVNRLRCVVRGMQARAVRGADGVARVTYGMKYMGAPHTGRWSGDSGLNVQNLPRAETFGVDVRQRLIASPGHKLIAVDLSQIEPRVLAWLAHDQKFLDIVATGVDIYEAHARATMNYTDKRPLKIVDPALRALAKARVLGLSYGASGAKFIHIAKVMAGVDIDLKTANKVHRDFHRTNSPIINFWAQLQAMLDEANKGDMTIELPSGRTITYFDVKGGNAHPVKGAPFERYWGSKLVENVTQGTAREVFAHALRRIQLEVPADILFHVHDEAVLDCPQEYVCGVLEQVKAIMSTAPDWLPGCPLACSAQALDVYGK